MLFWHSQALFMIAALLVKLQASSSYRMCKVQSSLNILAWQVGNSPTPLFVTLTQRKQSGTPKNSDTLDSQASGSLTDRSPSGSFQLYPAMSGVAHHPGVAFYPGCSSNHTQIPRLSCVALAQPAFHADKAQASVEKRTCQRSACQVRGKEVVFIASRLKPAGEVELMGIDEKSHCVQLQAVPYITVRCPWLLATSRTTCTWGLLQCP